MTRRDRCVCCNELVADYDLICEQCCESYCFNCQPIPYDSMSRLATIYSKIRVLCHPILTTEELKNILLDITSDQFINYCNYCLERYESTSVDKLNTIYCEIDKVKNKLIQNELVTNDNDDDTDDNKHNVEIMQDFFQLLEVNMYIDLIPYICVNCSN